jgi:predicted phage terminase large subunit-like protein
MSSKELSSYSACVVLQVKGESAYVLDVVRDRLEYPDLKRKVIEVHRNWRSACSRYELVIENKGSGMSLIQELKQENIYPVAVDPDGEKVMRMNAQTARIEAGSVLLPKRASWLDEFRREILAFPAGRYNDQVDAFSQALNRAFNRRGRRLRLPTHRRDFLSKRSLFVRGTRQSNRSDIARPAVSAFSPRSGENVHDFRSIVRNCGKYPAFRTIRRR